MLDLIFQSVWFMLPAYFANAIPVLLARYSVFEFLNIPVDFGYKLGSKPLFGANKTYRGIIGGFVIAIVVCATQSVLSMYFPQMNNLELFEYTLKNVLLIGFLLGFGTGLMDLFKSFIKRRLNISNGAPFVPFDQLDFLGGLFFSFLIFMPSANHIIAIIIISPPLPLIADVIAYKLGWKNVWW